MGFVVLFVPTPSSSVAWRHQYHVLAETSSTSSSHCTPRSGHLLELASLAHQLCLNEPKSYTSPYCAATWSPSKISRAGNPGWVEGQNGCSVGVSCFTHGGLSRAPPIHRSIILDATLSLLTLLQPIRSSEFSEAYFLEMHRIIM